MDLRIFPLYASFLNHLLSAVPKHWFLHLIINSLKFCNISFWGMVNYFLSFNFNPLYLTHMYNGTAFKLVRQNIGRTWDGQKWIFFQSFFPFFLFYFSLFHFSALIVRFLTKRFIGDYEANTGKFLYICLWQASQYLWTEATIIDTSTLWV